MPAENDSEGHLPYRIAALAVGSRFGEGYYLAEDGQVYAVALGQVPEVTPRLGELRRALDSLSQAGMPVDVPDSLRSATDALGFELERDPGGLTVRDGAAMLRLPFGEDGRALRRLAVCFCPERVSLAALVERVRDHAGLAEHDARLDGDDAFVVQAAGFEARVTRLQELDHRRAEFGALTPPGEAFAYKEALVLECTHTSDYGGGTYVPWLNAWMDTEEATTVNPRLVVAGSAIVLSDVLQTLAGAVLYDLARGAFR